MLSPLQRGADHARKSRLAQMAPSYESRPVKFVTISTDDPKDWKKIPAVLERLKVLADSWVSGDTDMMADFGLGNIVPGSVDECGEIVARVMGEAREQDVRTAVDWLPRGEHRAGAGGCDEALLETGIRN
jgi:hypothetical protein